MLTALQSLNNRADKIVTLRGEGVFHVARCCQNVGQFELWVGKTEDDMLVMVANRLTEDECRAVMNAIDKVLSELGR